MDKCRVVIVDDNSDNRLVIQSALKKYGCPLTDLSSAAEALELLSKERVDLLILDLHLHGMSGIELAQRVRKEHKEVTIIAVSGDLDALQSLQEGSLFDLLLSKPLERSKLREFMENFAKRTHQEPKESHFIGSGEKILIIDDKEENLELFSKILIDAGYEVKSAHNAHEALSSLRSRLPELILLDVVMPDVNGYELLEQIKSERFFKEIPVIFLTAKDTPQDIVKGFEAGVVDYISKPFHPKELLARVDAHLQKARIMSHLKRLLEHSFHELYTPLSVINTAMQVQELQFGKNEYTSMTLAASKTLQSIYDDLYYSIHYSFVERPFEVISLGDTLQTRLAYFALVIQNGNIEVDLDIEEDFLITAIEKDILRILDNILSNALKYAPKASKIAIKLHRLDDMRISLQVTNRCKSAPDVTKIFSKYYRHNTDIFGVGLGLELVRHLCDDNKIEIDAEYKEELFSINLIFKEAE